MMADLRSEVADPGAFRLDRFAAAVHEDTAAFSHSYLR